jgi:hypothetical protein
MMNDEFKTGEILQTEGMRCCIKNSSSYLTKNTARRIPHNLPSTKKSKNVSKKKKFTIDVEFEDRTQDLFRVKEAA